ncbi:MAG: type II secretion system minor pseudopilin GspH [Calditrichia bacterium]|nr:type II secretion system minor pseudopilin GspH [Calditrichia bacterium]
MVRARGFTIIEIMVVMLIIGLILGIAIPAININNPENQLKEEVTRLVALIDLASQESILNSRMIGIRTYSDQYEFLFLQEDKWKPLDDNLLTRRKLPEDIELELQIEDYLEDYPTSELSFSEEQQKVPHIILSGIGELTPPFTINIKSHSTETYFSIKGYENGKLETKKHSSNQ